VLKTGLILPVHRGIKGCPRRIPPQKRRLRLPIVARYEVAVPRLAFEGLAEVGLRQRDQRLRPVRGRLSLEPWQSERRTSNQCHLTGCKSRQCLSGQHEHVKCKPGLGNPDECGYVLREPIWRGLV
jgi:hypothetical protein